jgi:hypothetical protein
VLLQLLGLLLLLKLLLGLTLWMGLCRLLLLVYLMALPGTSAGSAPCSAAVGADFTAAYLRLQTPSCMPAKALQLVHCCFTLALRHPLTVVTCRLLLHNPTTRGYKYTIVCTADPFEMKYEELQLESTLAHSVSAALHPQRCANRKDHDAFTVKNPLTYPTTLHRCVLLSIALLLRENRQVVTACCNQVLFSSQQSTFTPPE